ncbi:MAG: hypothetical protein AB8B99_06800 [Phormidesmis sp.]
MKRFILSAFSIVLATAAIAPAAQALPKIDSDFNLQTLRLREFDDRNKSDEYQKPYYPEESTGNYPQDASTEQDRAQTAEPTVWEAPESQQWEAPENQQEEDAAPTLSITQRRQQELDRKL